MKTLTAVTIGSGLAFFAHVYCNAPPHQIIVTGMAFVVLGAISFVRYLEPQ